MEFFFFCIKSDNEQRVENGAPVFATGYVNFPTNFNTR